MGIMSKLLRKTEDDTQIVNEIPVRQNDVESLRVMLSAPKMNDDGTDPMSNVPFARIVEYSDGFGYEICIGETPAIVQRYHPEKEGNEPMSKDEATAQADKLLLTYGGK